jgi:glycerol-3-phosphate dehydrogenase (NAD(P)+)
MRIAVLGSGSWGMTLALQLVKNGHDVTSWFYSRDDYLTASEQGQLPDYLPGVPLPEELKFNLDLNESVTDRELLVIATPSHTVRGVVQSVAPHLSPECIIVNVAKGIENDSLLTMSQVIADSAPDHPDHRITSMYGPTHAEEVVRGMPSTIVAAGVDETVTTVVQTAFMGPSLRVYTNTDLLGVELGGSLKNVIAIAAGMLSGMGFGDNTLAALLTRGSFEITRLGVHLGAREETFAGLSGIGDLIVTCLSKHSRNRHVGFELGKGRQLDDILAEMKMVAEGIKTARSVHQLTAKTGVEMPISEQIYQVLFDQKEAKQAVAELMSRDPVRERHSLDS